MNYREWASDWLNYYVKPTSKARTYTKYKYILEELVDPDFGDVPLDAITAEMIQKFIIRLSEHYATNTVTGIYSVMKCSLKRAYRSGMTTLQLADQITLPRQREKQVSCFSVAEQKKIERYILQKDRPKLFGFILCLYTGLRIGELMALTWSDIDFRTGRITVSKSCHDEYKDGKYVKVIEDPKTPHSVRVIPMPRQLLPKLREVKARSFGSEYVVNHNGAPVSVRSYQATFRQVLLRTKLPLRGVHSLRHTFATRALECGMDVRTLSDLLGHTNATVTLNRYAHSMMEHKTEMMNKLGKNYL